MKAALVLVMGCLAMVACGKTDAAPAGPPSCDVVVPKMLSFQPGSGEPEKKLLTGMCPSMPAELKTCVVAAKDKAAYDACSKSSAAQKPLH